MCEQEPDEDAALRLLDTVERLVMTAVPSKRDTDAVETVVAEMCLSNDTPWYASADQVAPGASSVSSSDADVQAVAYARYVLALAHCCLCDYARADIHLGALALRFRLARSVWEALARRDASTRAASVDVDDTAASQCARTPVRVWAHALPDDMLSRLCTGLSPTSSFWAEHGYDEGDRGFFSFYYRLSDAPKNMVECCIQRLRESLRGTREVDCAVGVEWWAHKRCTSESWLSGCHQLHYDTDEATFDSGSGVRLRHPLASSVLYLSDSGGPTLVTDKTPGSSGLGTCGTLVWPELNRFMMFPGNALHGVLPAVVDADEPRLTLIVAWWDGSAEPRDNPAGHGPLQITPDSSSGWQTTDLPPSRGAGDHVDEGCMEVVIDFADAASPASIPGSVDVVVPLWERVAATDTDESLGVTKARIDLKKSCDAGANDGQSLPPLRYFLPSEDELERIYEQAAVEVYWEHELNAGRCE